MDRRRITGLRNQRGLTLLELLVVVTILALVVSIAVFNAPPPRSNARNEAERFAARLVAAGEDAVIEGAVMSIEMTPAGYSVSRYASGEWKSDNRIGRFPERKFARNVTAVLTLEDAARANARDHERNRGEAQRIVLDPVGISPVFTVEFADGRERWTVIGAGDGTIEVSSNGRR